MTKYRKYETLLLFSPELTGDEYQTLVDNLVAIIEREDGKNLIQDDWGMRDLAYPVQKMTRGRYLRLEYDSPGSLVKELERNIRITEGIFKFVTVKLADEVEGLEEAKEAA